MYSGVVHCLLLGVFFFVIVINHCKGKVAECKETEFISAVAIITPGSWSQSCSGALVTVEYVLTAEVCLRLIIDWENTTVVAGTQVLLHGGTVEKTTREIGTVLLYPLLNPEIMFLELKEPLKFSDTIGPITPKLGGYNGQPCTLVGWRTTRDEKRYKIKRKQNLNLNTCPYMNFNYNATICGRSVGKFKDCVGDIGSPIYCGRHLKALMVGDACKERGNLVAAIDIENYQDVVNEFIKQPHDKRSNWMHSMSEFSVKKGFNIWNLLFFQWFFITRIK